MPIKTSVVDQKPVVVGLFCEEQIEGGSYRGTGIKFERKILNATCTTGARTDRQQTDGSATLVSTWARKIFLFHLI